MQESTVYHFSRINNDNNGNPQYKFNVYIAIDNSQRNILRVITPKFGARFSKRHDAYVIKYYGNEAQTAQIIEEMIATAGYKVSTIA